MLEGKPEVSIDRAAIVDSLMKMDNAEAIMYPSENRQIIFASTDRGLIGYLPSMIILNAYPMTIGSLRVAGKAKAKVHLLASS